MSLKKTWFSYVLWVLYAGLTVLITYSILTVVLSDFYEMLGSYVVDFSEYISALAKILTMLLVCGVVLLLHFFSGKVKMHTLPKWGSILYHILLCSCIFAAFTFLRYPLIIRFGADDWSRQAECFYELAKVGGSAVHNAGTISALEQVYITVLNLMFLFMGNKIEMLLYLQLILQVISLILFMFIGWKMQKGVFAWIPAFLYAVMPSFYYTVEDVGYTNFWLCIAAFVLFVICIFERVWKKNNITYLVIVFTQMLFAGFVFIAKMDVMLYGKAPFVSGGRTPGIAWILEIEMLVLAFLLITYCVSFWFDKQDHKTLFVLPFIGIGVLFVWLSGYEFDASYCMMLLAFVIMFFFLPQSMRVIFELKPNVNTGLENQEKAMEKTAYQEEMHPADFEWTQMQEIMHKTDEIEVAEIQDVKIPVSEVLVEEVVIDKTAPIENVLPMPKKHKPKVLDYAFDPPENMMHYDIEIENDDYDY